MRTDGSERRRCAVAAAAPDFDGLRDTLHSRVLDTRLRLLREVLILAGLRREVDGERGRLDVFRYVDDLCEARHSQRDVLGCHAGIVERVERHLRRWLAQRLCRNGANHLPRLSESAVEAALNLVQQPVERLAVQLVLAQHLHAQCEPSRGAAAEGTKGTIARRCH
jgi:hypothetical protein